MSEEELSTIELHIKEQTENIGGFQAEEKPPIEIQDNTETLSEESDLRVKHMRRIP